MLVDPKHTVKVLARPVSGQLIDVPDGLWQDLSNIRDFRIVTGVLMFPRQILMAAVMLILLLAQVTRPAATDAQPGSQPLKVAVLPVEIEGIDADKANKLIGIVVVELREIGLFNVSPPEVVEKKVKRLKAKKIIKKDCLQSVQCVRRVGKNLKVGVIYHLHAAKALDGMTLTMHTLDARSGRAVRKAADFASDDPVDLERAVRWLTRTVSSPLITTLAGEKSKLLVKCEHVEAEVFINGKSFGKTTGKSFKVSAGVFDLVIQKEGYYPFHDVIVVKPGDERLVEANLKPLPGTKPPEKKPDSQFATSTKVPKKQPFLPDPDKKPGPDVKKPESRFYQTWWFWTLIGVGVAGAAGTTAYFLLSSGGPNGEGDVEATWR
jgi:PEGA domain-containing protein